MTNHLWQSTLFAAGAALLAWALRNHRASVGHALWFSASVKFLVPFAVLMSLGREAGPAVTPVAPTIATAVSRLTVPFPEIVRTNGAVEHTRRIPWIPVAWAGGVLFVVAMRFRAWRRVRAILRTSRRNPMAFPLEVRTSPGAIEPGLVGLWRSTLLLPEGIEHFLTPRQLDAVLAHELCHARRKDNLMAAVHMAVEALFWFHPLVWWIGVRLVETRELACDEAVLAGGGEPREYADAILNVCRRYVQYPLVCVSGVTGADLKRRIEAMFSGRAILPLGWWKRAVLAAAAGMAVLAPFLAGIVSAQSAKSFEVASVKLATGGVALDGRPVRPLAGLAKLTGSRLEYTDTIHGLIVRAYGMAGCDGDCDFVVGGPNWLRNDVYRIDAKLPEGAAKYDTAQFQLGKAEGVYQMLQSLLAERFGLKIHRETREVPVYALAVGPGGHKLAATAGRMKEYSDGTTRVERMLAFMPVTGNTIEGYHRVNMTVTNLSAEEFAGSMSGFMDRPVLDRTGLSGSFDFSLEFDLTEEEGRFPPHVGGPGLIKGLRDKLGLLLQSTKGPIPVILIDHIERPTEN